LEFDVAWLKGSAEREFERFVDDVTDNLVRIGYLMTSDPHETEDLVQETLLRVAKRWKHVSCMAYPAAYARRVLVNLVIDGRRRRARVKGELDTPSDIDGHANSRAREMAAEIESASEVRLIVASLPRRQRAVIVLRYCEDMPESEVAELLGCSIGTVKSTASRGVARLRQVWAAREPDTSQSQSSR
jgi:RNA polymerase sigma-70 factor (sigma-E family)